MHSELTTAGENVNTMDNSFIEMRRVLRRKRLQQSNTITHNITCDDNTTSCSSQTEVDFEGVDVHTLLDTYSIRLLEVQHTYIHKAQHNTTHTTGADIEVEIIYMFAGESLINFLKDFIYLTIATPCHQLRNVSYTGRV